jgi:hypothetical protein
VYVVVTWFVSTPGRVADKPERAARQQHGTPGRAAARRTSPTVTRNPEITKNTSTSM